MPNGDAVCNFSVAVTESWKGKDGAKKEQTTWYRVNAFQKLAEICGQYLKKGAQVMIVGKMNERKWTDKDGVERTSWELRADTMQMFGKTEDRQDDRPADKPKTPTATGSGFDDFEDDIPF
jgi:single-strand DNA-binding protein